MLVKKEEKQLSDLKAEIPRSLFFVKNNYLSPCLMKPISEFLVFGVFLYILLLVSPNEADYSTDDSSSVIEISQVHASSTPIMKNDSLFFYLDFIFKDFSSKFWSSYDSSHHVLTIEIYGREVRGPVINLPSSCPVNRLQIKNRKTKMALSGLLTTFLLTIEPGWKIDVYQNDPNTLRLALGKKMEVKVIIEGSDKNGNPRP